MHTMMHKVAVVTPLHKIKLNSYELLSLRHSFSVLPNRPVFFVIPNSLPLPQLHSQFPAASYVRFDDHYFKSTEDYSRLLVQQTFYENFKSFDYILILQADAIVFRDELDYWCSQDYDYIGAPWHTGYEFNVNLDKFSEQYGRLVRMRVGNGGLSLRRVSSCIDLIRSFPQSNDYFIQSGSNEDFFFGLLGSLSNSFRIPNEIQASYFSMEHRPDYYHKVNGGKLPMGAHGWFKIDIDFWRKHYPELSAI